MVVFIGVVKSINEEGGNPSGIKRIMIAVFRFPSFAYVFNIFLFRIYFCQAVESCGENRPVYYFDPIFTCTHHVEVDKEFYAIQRKDRMSYIIS